MLILSIFAMLIGVDEGHAAKGARITPLKVIESHTLPAVEISGLSWRRNPENGQKQLVAVGDREHKILLADWPQTGTSLKVQEIDIKQIEKKAGIEQSEWESVFSDDSGRIFIIQESPPQLIVVSSDLKSIELNANLAISDESAHEMGWNKDENARAEGVVPMSNGHILIVKEKEPLRILEFAPPGAKAQGYGPKLSIEHSGSFPLPSSASVSLNHVFTWRFSPQFENLLEDSSGLNADAEGELYILSDQRNMIGKIGKSIKPKKEKISIEKLWSLPSVIKQPEGMVIDERGRAIIAIDSKKTDKPNLFVLSPLK